MTLLLARLPGKLRQSVSRETFERSLSGGQASTDVVH
jgi:hypothetical protein